MLHQGITDVETIYNLLGGLNLLLFWEKFRSIVLQQRENYRESDYFVWWEYLIEEVRKFRVKQGLPEGPVHEFSKYSTL
jgi:hypothetical protein